MASLDIQNILSKATSLNQDQIKSILENPSVVRPVSVGEALSSKEFSSADEVVADLCKELGLDFIRDIPVNEIAVDLIRATRPHDPNAPDVVRRYVQYGASVRAAMFLTLAAKARALVSGRYHVTREDITKLALPVLRHRVLTNYFAESDGMDTDKILVQLLADLSAGGVRARAS